MKVKKESFTCKLCNVHCCTTKNLMEHNAGRRHKEALQRADLPKEGNSNESLTTDPLMCTVCNIRLRSEKLMKKHKKNKVHRKAVRCKRQIDRRESSILNKEIVVPQNGTKMEIFNARLRLVRRQILQYNRMEQDRRKCCIFVSGFTDILNREDILSCFSVWGEIVDHFFRDEGNFAIIQFSSENSVRELLRTGVELGGRKLHIKQADSETGQKNTLQSNKQLTIVHKCMKDASLEDFQERLNKFLRRVQPNELTRKYKYLCADLQVILQKIFPGCVVSPFGATEIGLGFSNSNVDLYVKVLKEDEAQTSTVSQNEAVENIVKFLESCQEYGLIFSKVETRLSDNRDRYVKFVHIPTKIGCDLTFTNWLGVCNSSLVRYYLSLDDKVKTVMIILKYWGQLNRICGSLQYSALLRRQFSYYSLALLLIFYLQQSPYLLPSVTSLQDSQNCIKLHEGWNGEFVPLSKFTSEPLSNKSIHEILHGFFDYYSNFDYSLNVICPYLGRTVPKTDFLTPELLPDEFDRYKTNIAQVQLQVMGSVCVQDPFEQNHNVTFYVSKKLLSKFVEYCRLGAQIYKNRPAEYLALYNLFTWKINSNVVDKGIVSNNECEVKILMDNHLLFVNSEITSSGNVLSDPDERLMQIKRAWHDLVNNFMHIILTDVMNFSVKIKDDGPDVKSRRLSDQADVHDTNVLDSITFLCSGSGFDATKESAILSNVTPHRHKKLINSICRQTYTWKDVELEINMQAKIEPTQVVFHVRQIMNKHSKSFPKFFAHNVASWFNKYINKLDKSVQKELTQNFTEVAENQNIKSENVLCIKTEPEEFPSDEPKEQPVEKPVQIKLEPQELQDDENESEKLLTPRHIKLEPEELPQGS